MKKAFDRVMMPMSVVLELIDSDTLEKYRVQQTRILLMV